MASTLAPFNHYPETYFLSLLTLFKTCSVEPWINCNISTRFLVRFVFRFTIVLCILFHQLCRMNLKLTYFKSIVTPEEFSVPLFFVFEVVSFVFSFIRPLENSLPVHFIILPFSIKPTSYNILYNWESLIRLLSALYWIIRLTRLV